MKFKNKFIAVISAAVMMLSYTAASAEVQRFWDVDSEHWAFKYISDLAERKVIQGYDDGSFRPNKTVSRSEWAKMMVDAACITAEDNSVYFTDLTATHWANKYINAAKQYLTGYKDGTFRPDQAITREDVAVALVSLKGYNTDDVDYSYLTFSDNDTISNYAKAYVAVAIQYDLISGFTDGTFRGQDTLSRGQAAALLYRGFQLGSADKVIGGGSDTAIDSNSTTSIEDEYINQAESLNKSDNNTEVVVATSVSVSTLVKNVSIDSVYKYTTDNRGNIYYLDKDVINKVNIETGNIEEFQSIDDLDLISDSMEFVDFQVSALCWDISDNELIIQGKYNKVVCDYPDDVVNSWLIKSPGVEGSLGLISADFQDSNHPVWEDNGISRIIATTSDGRLITNFQLLNGKASEELDRIVDIPEHWIVAPDYAKHAAYIGRNVYYVTADDTGSGNHNLRIYDFADNESLLEFEADAYGICKEGLYIVDDENLIRYSFKGKILKEISLYDINISDRQVFKSDNMLEKLVVYNGKVVFYDKSAKALRVIK